MQMVYLPVKITLTKRLEEGFCELLAYLWIIEMESKLIHPIPELNVPSAAENLDQSKYEALLKYVKSGDLRYHKVRPNTICLPTRNAYPKTKAWSMEMVFVELRKRSRTVLIIS